MGIAAIIAYGIAAAYGSYGAFIVYAMAANNWKAIPLPVKAALMPLLAAGYSWDVLANATIGSALFAGMPTTWTMTQRMTKLKAGPDGWRKSVATWICDKMLDPFQAGHC